ncbi:hypothetical protein [Azomonas macrocytogenes]|uniref:Uncharacterized protein n=1 Tax=Azomonas macrocytogenes TaxID=69962 RepID=A0A839TAE4_AZOMA|nr:hypothetical protein [Azomonas macrocytogenes]MBB3105426.1 hypothetical protein [Azomonas macrocytogenes]
MSSIITHKTDAMRKLQLLVARGHSRWTAGQVEPRKLQALTLKFSDRYGTEKTAQQRWRSKAKGEASSHLVLWQEQPSDLVAAPVHWWLVVTPGVGLVSDLEQLQDARRQRLSLTGYELAQMPRKGRLASWTWRMTAENYAVWEERLRTIIRHNDELGISQSLHSLRRTPPFAESRRQAFDLGRLAQAEWKRTKRGLCPYDGLYVGWFGRFQAAAKAPLKKPRC